MYLKEVRSRDEAKQFLLVPLIIYKDIPEWTRPLDKDIQKIFDPDQNKFFRHGMAVRWVLYDDNNNPIGRVAAFINNKTAGKNPQPTGGMGFFECINDQKAADELFNACVSWNRENGMEAMDGPVNFGERDRFWGLLVEGFSEPVYAMNFNPPYYRGLFEKFGFRVYFEQYVYSLCPQDEIDPKFEMAYQKLSKSGKHRIETIKKNDLKKYAHDFAVVYNKAWAKHGGVKELSDAVVLKMFQAMKPVMDEKIVLFAYYENEPIGIWVNLPELNYYFKRMNGKFGLVQKIRFLLLKWFTNNPKYYGLVFGVIPEYQGTGVDGFMIRTGQDIINRSTGYNFMEIQWIGDFNPKMISIVESLGTKRYRTLYTYRYLFDRDAPFERMKVISR